MQRRRVEAVVDGVLTNTASAAVIYLGAVTARLVRADPVGIALAVLLVVGGAGLLVREDVSSTGPFTWRTWLWLVGPVALTIVALVTLTSR